MRWFTTGLFFAFISSFHFYAFLPVRFPWDLLHLCRWGSVGVHPETVLFPPPTCAGGGHARDSHVGSERVPLAQRCLGRLGGAPCGNPQLRGCAVCCSRCRPVPSAACNAVKASQAWRWLQNQKAPCTLDEGKTATRLGTEELLYFFRGSGLLYIFAGFPIPGGE